MLVPIDTWGEYHVGEFSGWHVIIHRGRSGFDICLFPEAPSREVYYYWAGSQEDLDAWFDESAIGASPWITVGALKGVEWLGQGPPEDDPRLKR